MNMEKNENIIERLRQGEKIKCLECQKGIYRTSATDISKSHEFNCDNCGSVIRVTPNAVVE